MKKKLSRRDFIKAGFVIVGGGAAAGLTKLFGGPVARVLSNAGPRSYLPAVQYYEPQDDDDPGPQPTQGVTPNPPGSSVVVHVHNTNAHNWTSGQDYWSYVSQSAVDQMVDRGLMELTGTTTIAAAWRALLPNYKSGEKVAIKISLNNCKDMNGSANIDAVPEPINALVRGLVGRGVAAQDIIIYDSIRYIPTRFRNGLDNKSVTLRDTQNNDQFSWPQNYISFHPPAGIATPEPHNLNPVVVEATYLINVPIMKKHYYGSHVSLGFKNHFGSIQKPIKLHGWINPVFNEGPLHYSSNYSPYIDIYKYIKDTAKTQTILTVGDALFAAKFHDQPPVPWSTFGGQTPKSLFFAIDPVAIDCVMADFCVAEMSSEIPANHDDYLKLAENAGLGVHERRNPWTQAYTRIHYKKIT